MLVVIEGIDGTGKQTQTKALAEKLRGQGMLVETLSFPRYGQSRGSALVTKYLAGELGALDPFAAAMLYALDRLEAKPRIMSRLGCCDVVIVDRYVASNLAHQAARVESEDKREDLKRFILWLEYECHGMPTPDVQFLLRTTPAVAMENRSDRPSTDIHERDRSHQVQALQQYESLLQSGGWFVVDTVAGTRQRSPEDITHELFEILTRERVYATGLPSKINLQGLAGEIFGELMSSGSEERVKMCTAAAKRALHYLQKRQK